MVGKANIRFVDTTLRDGHLSLWASRMTTAMMVPAAERINRAGYEAAEIISGSNFKKSVRELREDPFERIRQVSARMPDTPLRVIAGRINTFGFDPESMYRLFLERVAANGVKEARISEPWNQYSGWKHRVGIAREVGLATVVNLIFSVSPRHSDDYYAKRTRQAASLPIDRLCLKDPGGLLTPERMRTLVPVILENANGKYVEFHTHCTTGLGPLCCLEAIKAGITTINTAIPPLADGASNPSIFNVAANARALGYQTDIDEAVLHPVSEHFTAIAKRDGLPIGKPLAYNYAQYLHQIPGGMISNLEYQLSLVGLADRLPEALEETARVRAELGYPIMVTPLSQFVGSQAAINVIIGERYREVTDQIIHYALGRYGEEGAAEMDPDIKDRILSRSRARELAQDEIREPSLQEMRRKYGGPGVSDEDMLLRWIVGKDDVDAMRATPPQNPATTGHPLVRLVSEFAGRHSCSRIAVKNSSMSLTMEKSATA
jgi:oxaloacetate decarboxylase alpha subunit